MTTRIFLTGATGYIGGEVLYQLSRLPVKHHIRCLVRDDAKADLVKKAIPTVETAKGDLEDTKMIEEEAKAADIVFHLASTRHEPSSRAIVKGLSDKSRRAPGYWFQIGGASMFAGEQIKAKGFGEAWDKTYNDVDDIEQIRDVIKASPARIIDNLILEQKATDIKTALVAGPIIYGKGRGPGNTNTIQGPAIAEYTLKNGESFQIGKGENIWSFIHVSDIAKVFVLLLEAALQGKDDLFDQNGIFLPENGHISFAEYGRLIAQAAKEQGRIQSENVKSLTYEEVDKFVPHGSIILGTTAHTSSSRANRYLNWTPAEVLLAEDIPQMVKAVAERLRKA